MNNNLSVLKNFKAVERRVNIYNNVIKTHKSELKKCKKNSKEYNELVEMINFVKNIDDYKRVNRAFNLSLIGLSAALRV